MEKNEEVLDFLEGRDDWETARIHPPKLILGNFQGVETGVRQLRRNRPLETEQVHITGKIKNCEEALVWAEKAVKQESQNASCHWVMCSI